MKLRFFALMFVMMALSPASFATDSNAGLEKSTFCERCHGPKGFTDNENMPKLAGQNKGYLIRQLKNFRRGIRKSAPMHQVTLTLSDKDIEDLAAYFSSIQVYIKD